MLARPRLHRHRCRGFNNVLAVLLMLTTAKLSSQLGHAKPRGSLVQPARGVRRSIEGAAGLEPFGDRDPASTGALASGV